MSSAAIDKTAAKFCADVCKIAEQYREEGAPLKARFNERIAKVRAEEKAALEEYRAAAVELNTKYRDSISQAAEKRKPKAKHPEDIDKAAEKMRRQIGGHDNCRVGGMSELEAGNARRYIENTERERRRIEEEERQRQEYAGRVLWLR